MDKLDEIRKRCDAATPGPWFNFGDWLVHTEADVEHSGIPHEKTIGSVKTQNAAFIAHAREDIPYLLSLLEETWEWDMYQCAKRETERLRGILAEQNARLNQYEAENRWIPVGERLPGDADGEVLVIASGKPHENITLDGAYMLATYSRPEGWILDEYPEWECANVTHWRPLPEPPEGV